MGVSLSWIASQTKFTDAEITELESWLKAERIKSAEATARFLNSLPGNHSAHTTPQIPEPEILTETKLDSGWWLILLERCDVIEAANKLLCKMSAADNREIIACFVEEHVMYSHTASYKNGLKVWRLIHDSNKDRLNLEVEGTPPPQYHKIAAEQAAGNAKEGNLFDVPVKVAEAIVGYNYGRPIRSIRFLR